MAKQTKENFINRQAVSKDIPVLPQVGPIGYNPQAPKTLTPEDMWNQARAGSAYNRVSDIPVGSIYKGDRFDTVLPGTDSEEMYAQQQSSASKWGNATAKMLGTASTTFVAGTAGLVYGVGEAIGTGRMSALIDNPITRAMDEIGKTMEDALPNYYTKQESEADWYAMDNILTANFWSDKVLKNLGFSLGALGGGVAWGSLFRTMKLTNKLVQAGKGMEAATAVEQAIAGAPNASKYTMLKDALGKVGGNSLKSGASAVLKDSERILVSVMATTGEASIEGLQALNEFRDSHLAEFKSKHGRDPNKEEMDEIVNLSRRTGLYVWGMNGLILTGTNYIQLPKILGSSRKADKALINGIKKEGNEFMADKATTFLGKSLATGKHVGRLLFAPIEGVEEGMQHAATTGVNAFFSRAYENKDNTIGFLEALNGTTQEVFTQGMHHTLHSKEGLESILIGMLSGGLQQSGVVGTYKNKDGNTRIGIGQSGNIGEYGITGQGGERGRNTATAVTELNKLSAEKALKDGFNYLSMGIGSQQRRQDAIYSDNVLEEKDAETDFALSYLIPRIKYGKIDSVMDDLSGYKSTAVTDFQSLKDKGVISETETAEQFIARVDNLQEMARSMDNMYTLLNDRYENQMVDGKPRFTAEVIDKMVFAATKVQSYNERLQDMSTDLMSKGVDVDAITETIRKDDPVTEAILENIYKEALKNTVDSNNLVEGTVSMQEVEDFAEVTLRRNKFAEEYKDMIATPEEYQGEINPVETPTNVDENGDPIPVETVTIKTKKGDIEVETGVEYYLGRRVDKTAKGHNFYSLPKLTVLGETEDGKVRIKDSNGERVVSKEEFESYNLSTVDSVEGSKKGRYFKEHWNIPFQFNLGSKKGGKVEGRLEYTSKKDKLLFVYKTKAGNISTIEVSNDQFAPSKGFKEAQIIPLKHKALKPFSAKEQAAQEEAATELQKAKDTDARTQEKVSLRINALSTLVKQLRDRREKSSNLIEKKTAQITAAIADIKVFQQEIKDAKGKANFKKVVRVNGKLAKQAMVSKAQLEKEVKALQIEESEAIHAIIHTENLIADVALLPNDTHEFLNELKEDQKELEALLDSTKKEQLLVGNLIKQLEKIIKDLFGKISSNMRAFESKYPEVPGMDTELADYMEEFPDYQADLDAVNEYTAGITEEEIPVSQKSLAALTDTLEDLNKKYKELNQQIKGRAEIISHFDQMVEDFEREKKEQKLMQDQAKITTDLKNSLDKGEQTVVDTKNNYEPNSKKPIEKVTRSTIQPTGIDGRSIGSYAERSNRFGNRIHNFKEKGKIFKGRVVNNKNFSKVAPGLFAALAGENTVNFDTMIALVITDAKGRPVDEFGEIITDPNEVASKGIFQVFPMDTLTATYKTKDGSERQSMFRKGTPDTEIERLRNEYKAWRKSTIEEVELPVIQDIDASFGIVEYVKRLDEDGKEVSDYDARTSVKEAGMTQPGTLSNKPVLLVGTNNDNKTIESVTFDKIKGRVLMAVPGGMIKLNNKKFSEKEADVLWQVLHQLTKNAVEDKSLSTPRSKVLFNYLRSTTFWGTPKGENESINAMWFDFEKTPEGSVSILHLGKKEHNFEFNPQSLEDNKEQIIGAIMGMYNNAHSRYLTKNTINERYWEIVGFHENGHPMTVKWPNYQTYLVSDMKPNQTKGKDFEKLNVPREQDEIPFATNIRPLQGEEDTNRVGVYFSLTTPAAKTPAKVKEVKTTKTLKVADTPKVAEGAPKTVQATVHTPAEDVPEASETNEDGLVRPEGLSDADWAEMQQIEETIRAEEEKNSVVLDGQKINTIELGNIGEIEYKANLENIVKRVLDAGKDLNEVLGDNTKLMNLLNSIVLSDMSIGLSPQTMLGFVTAQFIKDVNDNDTAKIISKKLIIESIAPQINAMILDQAIEEAEEPANTVDPNLPDEVEDSESQGDTEQENELEGIVPDDVQEEDDFDEEWDDTTDELSQEDKDNKAFRLEDLTKLNQFKTEKWDKLSGWLKQNFPNVPVYRVKNVIRATNGKQAWGMFQDGAIYVYEGAEEGTVYHEVFEAVWSMFATPQEKKKIIDEFRATKGTFVDRETQKTIEYAKASNHQVKEEMAEEFRTFTMTGKTPKRTPKSFLRRLFEDIKNFITTFFTGKDAANNVNTLFSKIGNGYYSKYNQYETRLSFANEGYISIEDAEAGLEAELRVLPTIQQHEVVQQLTAAVIEPMIRTNQGLFKVVDKLNEGELYKDLYKEIFGNKQTGEAGIIKKHWLRQDQYYKNGEIDKETATNEKARLRQLQRDVKEAWPEIVKKHRQQLRVYDIVFDENTDEIVDSEDQSKKYDSMDGNQIDHFKKANKALKLLFATLPDTEYVNGESRIKRSSIGGVTFVESDKVFITLMNHLHDSTDLDQMLKRLRDMSLEDGNYYNYQKLYERLTGVEINSKSAEAGVLNIQTTDDARILIAFWNAIKKQNPDVLTVFKLETGEMIVGDTDLTNSARISKYEMTNAIKNMIVSGKSPYFDRKGDIFVPTKRMKNPNIDSSKLEHYTGFLRGIGINIPLEELSVALAGKPTQMRVFKEAVEGIIESFSKMDELYNINSRTLQIEGRLMELGMIQSLIANKQFESTYFNISGERTQTYIGTNYVSDFYDNFKQAQSTKDLGKIFLKYLVDDAFSKGSVIMSKVFDLDSSADKTKERKFNTEDIMKPVYIGGTVDTDSQQRTPSHLLDARQRYIQEINLNLNGVYMNLVPGDASLEWGVRMHGKHSGFVTMGGQANGEELSIFRDYFVSELEVAREERPVAGKDRKSRSFRFFSEILDEQTQEDLLSKSLDDKEPIDIYYEYQDSIDTAVSLFLEDQATETRESMEYFGLLSKSSEGEMVFDVAFEEKDTTKKMMDAQIQNIATNYVIANIEMHKLIYSDPYQYTDELKRIKNFNSPRQALLHSSLDMNQALDIVYNKDFATGSLGHSDMEKDYMRTVVLEDTWSVNKDFDDYMDPYEETDGGGLVTMKANRIFRIRTTDWNDNNEAQYRFDIGFEEIVKNSGLEGEALAKALEKYETEYNNGKGNPDIKDSYKPLKPIVSGGKENRRGYNDVVLDKYALFPMSFRLLYKMNPESNLLKMSDKMAEEEIDYGVFASGRKVGKETTHALYDQNGEFNNEPFQSDEEMEEELMNTPNGGTATAVTRIPFRIMGLQTEVPSKDKAAVTRGSQITKLVTLDYLEGGIPIDFQPDATYPVRFATWGTLTDTERELISPLYKEIQFNQMILEEQTDEAYERLLESLGIESTKGGFVIANRDLLVDTISDEVFKQEVNDNIFDAFQGFKNQDVILVATPVYQQVRNILFSIAKSRVTKPKISGGLKVQVPVTLLEKVRAKVEKINGKDVYTSKELGFYSYKKGDKQINAAEIMVGRWFKSDKTDEELIASWYTKDDEGNTILTKEGKDALSVVGYRTPTQKQNSIDVFIIKKFLPNEYGDSVILPSAIVKKSGSDFDIDKISLYFKNLYKGSLKVIPYFGTGRDAKDAIRKEFQDRLKQKQERKQAEIFNNANIFEKLVGLNTGKLSKKQFDRWAPIMEELINERLGEGPHSVLDIINWFKSKASEISTDIANLKDEDLQKMFEEDYVNRTYKASLENAYYDSLQKLILNPLNYENLTKPNSAEDLKDIVKNKLNPKLGRKEIDYMSPGFLLSRKNMNGLRHAFVSGKSGIAIAAIAQTNLAQNQRTMVYVDPTRLIEGNVPDEDKTWLRDGSVNFQRYNKALDLDGVERPVLSMSRNQDTSKDKRGWLISDIIGMFIDGYVDISKGPWIMELGAGPQTAGTWLFLIKLGVPIETVTYFMNQPIVMEYLQYLQENGIKSTLHSRVYDDMLDKYKSPSEPHNILPGEEALYNMVGKSLSGKGVKKENTLTDQELAAQVYILEEFTKYTKMGQQLLHVTQGTNMDTAVINDPFLLMKKQLQLEKANNTMMSAVVQTSTGEPIKETAANALLEKSYVGNLNEVLADLRDAFSTMLISDSIEMTESGTTIRNILERVLTPYANLGDKAFIKISQKAVESFFDWAVQTDRSINNQVGVTMLGDATEKSAAQQIMAFKDKIQGNIHGDDVIEGDPDHPLYKNMLLTSLVLLPGDPGKPFNLQIIGRDNKVYDQNQIINSFKEIKDYVDNAVDINDEDKGIYGKLVRLAIIQSGLSSSPISFSKLLPYEDFKEIYNVTLSNLGNMDNLQNFEELKVLQRNNWNYYDMVPTIRAEFKKAGNSLTGEESWFNPATVNVPKSLKNATQEKRIPNTLFIELKNYQAKDIITYTYMDNINTVVGITEKERQRRIKAGDTRYIHKHLMQKVYREDGSPLIHTTERGYMGYVYKSINAWGDSFRAQEFYDYKKAENANEWTVPASKLDNGYTKIIANQDGPGEVSDDLIVQIYDEGTKMKGAIEVAETVESVVEETATPTDTTKPFNIYYSTGDNSILSNLHRRNFTFDGREYESVEHAYQTLKSGTFDEATYNRPGDFTGTKRRAPKKVDRAGNLRLMERLIRASLLDLRNIGPLTILLDTENAPITHENLGGRNDPFWMKNFPEIMSKLRTEFNSVIDIRRMPPKSPKAEFKLRDGKTYSHQVINNNMLRDMGYPEDMIEKMLKQICKP